MKELKTRFTKWYNRRHERRGTLWMERFKSVLVEGQARGAHGGGQRAVDQVDALRVMALYIDLNPVRSGLVVDTAEYRWCGYAAAVAGDKALREGLVEVTGERSWVRAAAVYGEWLMDEGERGKEHDEGRMANGGEALKAAPAKSEDEAQRAEPMRMGMGELLRCRVRYFSDGGVIGSRGFVNEHRQRNAQDRRRVPVIRELRAAERLHCLRQLRVEAVTRMRQEIL